MLQYSSRNTSKPFLGGERSCYAYSRCELHGKESQMRQYHVRRWSDRCFSVLLRDLSQETYTQFRRSRTICEQMGYDPKQAQKPNITRTAGKNEVIERDASVNVGV